MAANEAGVVRVLGLREGALPRLAPLRGLEDLRVVPLVASLAAVPIGFFFFFTDSFDAEFMEIIVVCIGSGRVGVLNWNCTGLFVTLMYIPN